MCCTRAEIVVNHEIEKRLLSFYHYHVQHYHFVCEVIKADWLMLGASTTEFTNEKLFNQTVFCLVEVCDRKVFLKFFKFCEPLLEIGRQDPTIAELSVLVKL